MKKTFKKSLALLLAAVMLFGASPIIGLDFSTPASAASVSDLTFVLINCDTAYEVSDCNQTASGELIIPASYAGKPVASIGSQAFVDCSALTSVIIPVGVTSIGDSAFFDCSALERVSIPNGLESIGNIAFGNCGNLERITIPGSVRSIGDYAFAGCISFESVAIPDGVTSIGEYAFSNCSKLASVTIPSSVTKIGTDAFKSTKIYNTASNWTNQVLYINNCLVNSQSGIAACDVTAGTRLIADGAFFSCNSLESVTVPASVTSIGDTAFGYCGKLEEISVASSNQNYSSEAGVLFSKDKKVLVCYPNGKAGASYSIPNGVTRIEDNAFNNCEDLTIVTLPAGLASIGEYAFYYCVNLESINIPSSVTSIGNLALQKTAYFDNESNWINDVLYIDNCLILGRSGITSCDIMEGTHLIADNAFANLSHLASVTIPNSVSNIGDWAFSDCVSLLGVAIPDGVTSIGDYLFYDCSSLASVDIPDEVTSIGIKAFYNCESLKRITIPDGITSIGDYLFFNCIKLESVTIPMSVESIGYRAFQFCVKITDVYYSGDESDMEAIEIDSDNGSLVNATWHCIVKVSGVTVSPASKTLTVNATQQLTATVAPANATNKVVAYTSSDTAIARVSETGLVTAISAGTATITVTTEDGSKTATCAITVAIPVTGVTLNITSKTLAVGAQQQLTAIVAPDNATNKDVVWSSSDDGIATVDTKGLVTAIASGATTIIATTEDGGKFAVCTISVTVPVISVALGITSKTLAVGATQQLTATVAPDNATNKDVVWSSSDEEIAAVSETGLVTAISAGTATITVTTADGNKTAACAITVANPTVSINNNPGTKTINFGDELKLTATANYAPEGAVIVWYVNGAEKGRGAEYTAPAGTADYTVTVKLVDKGGNIIKDADNKEITDEEDVTVKAGFFQKLINFFKNLFGAIRIVPQAFKQF